MIQDSPKLLGPALAGAAILALAACGNGTFDWDLRPPQSGISTTEAARQATLSRPEPNSLGVISYDAYDVAVVRPGDTIPTIAQRLGLDAGELARYNALEANASLRAGELLALPRRVGGGTSTAANGSLPRASTGIDVASIATEALDRAGTAAPQQPRAEQVGPEPIRHQVRSGETAFSIARLYNVSTRSLADWNGLGADMEVRTGQILIVPVAAGSTAPQQQQQEPPRVSDSTPPGAGSPTPTPPSASQPLPLDDPATVTAELPLSPNLGAERTTTAATTGGILAYPVQGSVIREFQPGRNDGISLAAPAGTPVRAAADGTVAAITRDTDQIPILVIRHADNLLTVYANIDDIRVQQGDQVRRGDTIATVRAGDPSFIHFEVRQGFDTRDPMDFLS